MEQPLPIPVITSDEVIDLGAFGCTVAHYIRCATPCPSPGPDGGHAYTLETSSTPGDRTLRRNSVSAISPLPLAVGQRIEMLYKRLTVDAPPSLVAIRYVPVLQTVRPNTMNWSFWKIGDGASTA